MLFLLLSFFLSLSFFFFFFFFFFSFFSFFLFFLFFLVGVGVEGKQGMGWRNDEDGVEVISVSALFEVIFVCFCFVRGYLCFCFVRGYLCLFLPCSDILFCLWFTDSFAH